MMTIEGAEFETRDERMRTRKFWIPISRMRLIDLRKQSCVIIRFGLAFRYRRTYRALIIISRQSFTLSIASAIALLKCESRESEISSASETVTE